MKFGSVNLKQFFELGERHMLRADELFRFLHSSSFWSHFFVKWSVCEFSINFRIECFQNLCPFGAFQCDVFIKAGFEVIEQIFLSSFKRFSSFINLNRFLSSRQRVASSLMVFPLLNSFKFKSISCSVFFGTRQQLDFPLPLGNFAGY